MKKKIAFLVILFLPFLIFSHTHWIIPDHFFTYPSENITLSICSGHYFPESALAIDPRWITDLKIIGPSVEISYLVSKRKNLHTGVVQLRDEGIYLCRFQLQKTKSKDPMFYGATLLYVGDPEFSTRHLKQAEGFSVVPQADLRKAKPGEPLLLLILFDGAPISANCQIHTDQRRPQYLNSDKKGILSFAARRNGKYLLTISHKDLNASFAFRIGSGLP